MDFGTAVKILGGFTLGGMLLICGLFLFAVVRTVQIRKGNRSALKGAVKPIKIIFMSGAAVGLISLIFMFATGSFDEVKTLVGTMQGKESAIYNNSKYVRTALTYNGTADYKLEKVTAYSGEGDIKAVNGYSSYDVLVAMNSNITGTVFIREDQEEAFNRFYTDYSNNFKVTATFDSKSKQPEDISSKVNKELFSALKNEKNLCETDPDSVPYSDSIAEEKSIIMSATSLDALVTEQVRIYPKDKNGNYITVLADGEDMHYYEIDKSLNLKIKALF